MGVISRRPRRRADVESAHRSAAERRHSPRLDNLQRGQAVNRISDGRLLNLETDDHVGVHHAEEVDKGLEHRRFRREGVDGDRRRETEARRRDEVVMMGLVLLLMVVIERRRRVVGRMSDGRTFRSQTRLRRLEHQQAADIFESHCRLASIARFSIIRPLARSFVAQTIGNAQHAIQQRIRQKLVTRGAHDLDRQNAQVLIEVLAAQRRGRG